MKKFNEVVATDPKVESVFVPIGVRMTISKVKK
ncbi:methyltransferase [Bacillus toyonensis]